MKPDECAAVAALIHRSTNSWYESHAIGTIFSGEPESCGVFCDVYEDLDPGQCIVAEDESSGQIVGSCFFHPRETHCSLGIMNSDPDLAGKGVAKVILDHIIGLAEERGQPLRLFSSALNLDSFSLYNRRGFQPYGVFQDMVLPTPPEVEVDPRVRQATLADVDGIDELEREVWGTSRAGDWRYFIENTRGIWHVSVLENEGRIAGALASVAHPGLDMLGPGVMRHDARFAEALILAERKFHADRCPTFLVPSTNRELLAALYAHGARNCENPFRASSGNAS